MPFIPLALRHEMTPRASAVIPEAACGYPGSQDALA